MDVVLKPQRRPMGTQHLSHLPVPGYVPRGRIGSLQMLFRFGKSRNRLGRSSLAKNDWTEEARNFGGIPEMPFARP